MSPNPIIAGALPSDPYTGWQNRNPNRRAVGYLCSYVPEELIHAAGFTPIRIMPNTAPAMRADAHLQAYTCSMARSCLDQALAGKLDFLDGVVFAHTCDTMQGLSDIWRQSLPHRYVETVVGPVALNSPHARRYAVAELRRLAGSLEKHFGDPITDDALRASIRLYNERRRALAHFNAQRESFTVVEWFNVMNAALLMAPEEFSAPAPSRAVPADSPSKVRLALVGSTIDEPALPQILDGAGAQVVADDFCNGARYFDTLVAEGGDPFEALAERELTRLPCPCKHRDLNQRENHLLKMVQEHRVQGVIFYLKKFCDPHAWDYVPLAAALDRVGIPHLQLEAEQVSAMGQTRVRVEAFLEMILGI